MTKKKTEQTPAEAAVDAVTPQDVETETDVAIAPDLAAAIRAGVPKEAPKAAAALYTDAELARMREEVREMLEEYLRAGDQVTCHGLVDEQHMELTMELATPSRDDVVTFVAALDLQAEEAPSLAEGRALLVEFLAAMWMEWMRDNRWPPPHLDWKEYRFSDTDLLFRGSQSNEALERLADAWLEKGGDPEL